MFNVTLTSSIWLYDIVMKHSESLRGNHIFVLSTSQIWDWGVWWSDEHESIMTSDY